MSPRGAVPALRLEGITKRFGSLVANDAISLELGRGEVLALLGENGAGKSTLVSILFGHYVADAGRIEVEGQPLRPGDTRAALAAGIGMVHQHFTLAPNLSVLDNVMVGMEPLWWPFSRRAAMRKRLLEAAAQFGLEVAPDAPVASLSVGERQRVEILKALVRGARILILDEPTAVLTPQESESLFATLQQLVAKGLSIIFISHKLDEVLRVSHRIAVLRAGQLVAQFDAAGSSKAQLAEAMVGRSVVAAVRHERHRGEAACVLEGATVRGTGTRPLLDAVGLTVHAGEVVAIAGVAGNGQDALADLLCGMHALDGGTLRIAGQALPPRARAFVAAGVARVPEDRHAVGVVGDLPLWQNAVLETYATPAFSRAGLLRRGRALAYARALIERFDVRGGDVFTPARRLSGGNMQKLILGRVLMSASASGAEPPAVAADGTNGPSAARTGDSPSSQSLVAAADATSMESGVPAAPADDRSSSVLQGHLPVAAGAPPPLIVANQPTWGLDIGAVADVHQRLLDACARGSALLLISEDLDEIFALADRIGVMHQGRLGALKPAADWTLTQIGLAMAGQHEA